MTTTDEIADRVRMAMLSPAEYDRETRSIHLQAVGRVPAVPADELKVGDRVVYNFGSTARVVSVEPKGKASLIVTTQADVDMYHRPIDPAVSPAYSRTVRRSSMIGVLPA